MNVMFCLAACSCLFFRRCSVLVWSFSALFSWCSCHPGSVSSSDSSVTRRDDCVCNFGEGTNQSKCPTSRMTRKIFLFHYKEHHHVAKSFVSVPPSMSLRGVYTIDAFLLLLRTTTITITITIIATTIPPPIPNKTYGL